MIGTLYIVTIKLAHNLLLIDSNFVTKTAQEDKMITKKVLIEIPSGKDSSR